MKLVLAIMCGLIVLFMGGCAVLLLMPQGSGTMNLGMLGLAPAALAVLNLLVLGGLYGWNLRWRPAFYILGVIDIIVAAGMLIGLFAGMSDPTLRSMSVLFIIVAFVVGLKGVLTFVYAKSVGSS